MVPESADSHSCMDCEQFGVDTTISEGLIQSTKKNCILS